jgi:hypothetical protein
MVRLSPEQLDELNEIVNTGRKRSRRVLLAMALMWLDCDECGPAKSESYVSNTLGLSLYALEELKRLFHLGGPRMALSFGEGTGGQGRTAKINELMEVKLIELANSEAPQGRNRWSVRLLAERAMKDQLVPSISHMTVYRLLKKHNHPLVMADN